MKKSKMLYISVLALVAILFSVAYFSYAFFMRKFEFNGKLNIVAGELNYRIESDYLDSNNSLTIPANTELKIEVSVVSLNTINARYQLYYTTTDNTGIDIEYSTYKDSAVSNINKNEKKTVLIKATNTNASDKTVTFNVAGGFKDTNVIRDGGYAIGELDPITLTINYNDGTTASTTKQVLYGEPYNIENPTRPGYLFKGWHGKNIVNIRNYNNITNQTSLGSTSLNAGTYSYSAVLKNNSTINVALRTIDYDNDIIMSTSSYVTSNKTSISSGKFTILESKKITIAAIGKTEGYNVDISNIQLEEGSISTPYEPYYIEKTTPVTKSSNYTVTAEWEPILAENISYIAPAGVSCSDVQCMIEYLDDMIK